MSTIPRIVAALTFVFALACAPADAQEEKPVLTVYTYSSFAGEYGPGAEIKARFEETCGCTLEWVTSDDAGTLLARLKLEGGSTDADTFVPFDWGWFAFVYDETRLPDPPASLAELVDAENGPKIVIEDPRTSTPGLGLLLWMREVYGGDSAAAWQRLAPKIVTVTQGWSEAYGMFLEGEADMVLSYTTSPAYHIATENAENYKAAIFPEGHYLQVEVAGITQSADDPDLARSFLRFMLSEPFQAAIPEGNWMYPAVMPEAGLPESFAGLAEPERSLLVAPDDVEQNRRAWVDEWLAAMSR
jgi:thiamine transport system substrate-binding protein